MSLKHTGLFLLLAGLFLCVSALPADASVTNEGDDAVLIEFYRPGLAPRKETLYPGQTIAAPDNTKMVKVIPIYSRGRGDENIIVRVREPNGEEGTIEEFGGMYELNKPEETAEEEITYAPGKVTNYSNIVVTVMSKTDRRMLPSRTLYVEDSVVLASDVKEVKIGSLRPLRGDESVNVEVMMPDGETYNVTGINTILKVAEPQELGTASSSTTLTSESSASSGLKTYVGVGSPAPEKARVSTNTSPQLGADVPANVRNAVNAEIQKREGTFKGGKTGRSAADPNDPDAETSAEYTE